MNSKQDALKVMSDLIESVDGTPIDLADWDFDQLVRVLRMPNELAGLCDMLSPLGSFPSDPKRTARALLSGSGPIPVAVERPRTFDAARVEVTFGGVPITPYQDQRYNHGPPSQTACNRLVEDAVRAIEGMPKSTQIVVIVDPRETREQRQLQKMADFGFTYGMSGAGIVDMMQRTRERMRITAADLTMQTGAPLLIEDRAADSARFSFFGGIPISDSRALLGSSLHSLIMSTLDEPARAAAVNLGSWFEKLEAGEQIVKRKKFKQARAPGEPRNPMPAASPFKRARR